MKKIFSIVLTTLMMLSFNNTAFAATTTGTMEISAGTLSLSNTPTSIAFGGVTIDGLNWQWTASDITPIRVQDGRGTGQGWNLTVSATQLTQVGGQGLVLKQGTLGIYAPTSAQAVNDTDPLLAPTLATGVQTIDGNPYTLATASTDTGMGTFDLIFPTNAIEINLHPSEKAIDAINFPSSPTTYETTITWTLNNTP